MNRGYCVRRLESFSDNRKSEIRNRKLVGIVAVVVTLAMCVVVAEAQQPKKVHRIGYLSPFDPVTESAPAEAIRLAAMWMSSQ